MNKGNQLLLFSAGALLIVVTFGLLIGSSGLTGFATASPTTTTSILMPAEGSSFKKGDTFTVSAFITCEGAKCNSVKSTLSFNPSSGLSLPSGGASKSLSSMNKGATKTVTWLVKANSLGNYNLKVSTTSTNAGSSSKSLGILVYTPACSSNSQCGSSGYVSSNYCGANASVYRDYRSVVCNNPGTISASCSSSMTAVKQKDCGQTGPVGPTYCQDGNVFQQLRSPQCSNSVCSNLTIPTLIQTCAYGCTSGVCDFPVDSGYSGYDDAYDSVYDAQYDAQYDGGYGDAGYGSYDGTYDSSYDSGYGPVCGNGIVEPGESCDDGNQNNNDGCTNYCQVIVYDYGYDGSYGAASCTDNDNGLNYWYASTVSGYKTNGLPYTYGDYCWNSTHVVERYCVSNQNTNVTFNCKYNSTNIGCQSGRCI